MIQFSFAADEFLYFSTDIRFSVNKPNFSFKGKSRISTDGFNKINVSVLQFNILKFPSQTNCHFSEIFAEFSLTNLGCNYELDWNELYKNKVYYINIFENQAGIFFVGENKTKFIPQK